MMISWLTILLCSELFTCKVNTSLIFSSVDSILLLENGFKVRSFDASDKMLKYALKTRWERRKEPAFDEWGKK